jgi:hypothetical protein
MDDYILGGAMEGTITIELCKWKDWQARRDIKSPSWFKCSHDLFDDDELHDLTNDELVFFLYLLCRASKANEPVFKLNLNRIYENKRFSRKVVLSAFNKLQQNQIVEIVTAGSRTCAYGSRPDPVRARTDHGQQTRLEETRLEEKREEESASLPPLAVVWNESCGDGLSKVIGCSSTRNRLAKARWLDKPDPAYWKEVISKIKESSFCLGQNDRGWKADFDFLIRPDTHLKVLEGKYGGKKRPPGGIDWAGFDSGVSA